MINEEKALFDLVNVHKVLEYQGENQAKWLRYAGSTIFRSDGFLSPSGKKKHFIMRVSKSALVYYYKNRQRPIIKEIIADLYNTGIGLPKDKDKATYWYDISKQVVMCKCKAFLNFSKCLKIDIVKSLGEKNYSYDWETNKLRCLQKLCKNHDSSDEVQCVLVYREGMLGYYLYDIIVNNDTGVYAFGNIKIPKQISLDYGYKFIVVTGFLKKATKKPLIDVCKYIIDNYVLLEKKLLDFQRSLIFVKEGLYVVTNDWLVQRANANVVAATENCGFKTARAKL